jgi:hypothetical protein
MVSGRWLGWILQRKSRKYKVFSILLLVGYVSSLMLTEDVVVLWTNVEQFESHRKSK